jgi:NCAIR mutase (PurE)-related protein
VSDLGFARVDVDRAARTGDPEVVYGAGKTPDQVVAILRTLHERHPDRAVLATRLDAAALDVVARALPDATTDLVARAVTLGPLPAPRGTVAIVSAGTSDAPVAAEAALTVRVHGAAVDRIDDVGVAGLHRLLAVRDRLTAANCLVVVAGMEGALPSVVGGLTGVPLVAVPTSVGYGASFGGLAALLGMLNSCAPGVTVVNIDNGYGAGVFAARVARSAGPRRSEDDNEPRGSGPAASAHEAEPRSADPRRSEDDSEPRGSGPAASAHEAEPRSAGPRRSAEPRA